MIAIKNAYNPIARKDRFNKITEIYIYMCLVPFWSAVQVRSIQYFKIYLKYSALLCHISVKL